MPSESPFKPYVPSFEGFTVVNQPTKIPQPDYLLGPQHIRNKQQRSQQFLENRNSIGDMTQYNDEDLLYDPTYLTVGL